MVKRASPYLTWGCADELTCRLKKTLYCSDEYDCFESSSAALTDVAVTMVLDVTKNPKRKLTHRYASSLTRQLPISPCAIIMSLLYAERLRQVNPGYLDCTSSSDIYVVSLLVASKFLTDEGEEEEVFNDEWAESAGLAVSTVNKLEREFLSALDWNLYVKPSEFIDFCSLIETKIALKYGLKRGWFSYTDLTQFLLASQYQKILKEIMESTVKIISGCTLLYGMSLSLLATSIVWQTSSNHLSAPQNGESGSDALGKPQCLKESYSRRCITRMRSERENAESSNGEHSVKSIIRTNETRFDQVDMMLTWNLGNTEVKDEVKNCTCNESYLRFEYGFPAFLQHGFHLMDTRQASCDSARLKSGDNRGGKVSKKKLSSHHQFEPTRTMFGMVVM